MMKIKVTIILFVIGVCAFSVYNVQKSNNSHIMSELTLKNIEALAEQEGTTSNYSAVKGTESSNGSLKRTKDSNGKCVFKLLIKVSDTGDCYM